MKGALVSCMQVGKIAVLVREEVSLVWRGRNGLPDFESQVTPV